MGRGPASALIPADLARFHSSAMRAKAPTQGFPTRGFLATRTSLNFSASFNIRVATADRSPASTADLSLDANGSAHAHSILNLSAFTQ